MRIYQEHTAGARRAAVGCFGCLPPLLGVFGTVAASSASLIGIHLSRQGSDEAAIAAFSACPGITTALGAPLRRHPLSFGCGGFEGSGSSGDANWQITVKGPRGSAAGWYTASFHDGQPWVVTSGMLTLPSGQVVALPCAPEPAAPAPGGDRRGKGKRKH